MRSRPSSREQLSTSTTTVTSSLNLNTANGPVALDQQGIFREPGSKVDIQELVSKINAREDIKFGQGQKFSNFYTVADMIKLYLRQLKEPLIPFELYDSFFQAVNRGAVYHVKHVFTNLTFFR